MLEFCRLCGNDMSFSETKKVLRHKISLEIKECKSDFD